MIKLKYLNKIIALLCTFSIIIVLFVHNYYNYEDVSLGSVNLINMNDRWTYSYGDDYEENVSLPLKKEVKKGEKAAVIKYLTGEFKYAKTLILPTYHQKIEVYLNDVKIYSYGYLYDDYTISKTKGSMNHYIKIPKESEGKKLTIYFSSEYEQYSGVLNQVMCGDSETVMVKMFANMIPSLLMVFLLAIIAFICFGFYFVAKKHKYIGYRSFPMMAFCALLVVFWALAQFNIYNIIFGDPQMSYYIEYFSLLLLPIACNGYIYLFCKSNKRLQLKITCGLYIANFILNIILQFNSIVDMVDILSIFFGILIANIIQIIVIVIYEVKYIGNETLKIFKIPMCVMMVTGVIAIIFQSFNKYDYVANIILVSVLFLIFFFIFHLITDYFKVLSEKKKADYMLQIADIDMMTKALNRNAYEKELKSYDEDIEKLSGTIVVLFDLNYLKHINDTYGHEYGDMAITTCYECMAKIFFKKGKCFRIGGDEFVCISHEETLDKEVLAFKSLIKSKAKEFVFPFTVALGVARFNDNVDNSIHDTIKRSDEMMYKNKMEIKKKLNKR
ncbi:MAG: GGDEF domain-containing protein [Clostridium sp.]|nr:GGDEF domain-containing protein [Clostridium sp.]MDY3828774.1 GGDEF domain-containing protein [Clostridium sp.]